MNRHSERVKRPNPLRTLKKMQNEAIIVMKSLKNNNIFSIPFGIEFSNVILTENISVGYLLSKVKVLKYKLFCFLSRG